MKIVDVMEKVFQVCMCNPLMPGGNKKVIYKQVCLSMRNLFVTTRHWSVKNGINVVGSVPKLLEGVLHRV